MASNLTYCIAIDFAILFQRSSAKMAFCLRVAIGIQQYWRWQSMNSMRHFERHLLASISLLPHANLGVWMRCVDLSTSNSILCLWVLSLFPVETLACWVCSRKRARYFVFARELARHFRILARVRLLRAEIPKWRAFFLTTLRIAAFAFGANVANANCNA